MWETYERKKPDGATVVVLAGVVALLVLAVDEREDATAAISGWTSRLNSVCKERVG